jgi:hypothetical protein
VNIFILFLRVAWRVIFFCKYIKLEATGKTIFTPAEFVFENIQLNYAKCGMLEESTIVERIAIV